MIGERWIIRSVTGLVLNVVTGVGIVVQSKQLVIVDDSGSPEYAQNKVSADTLQ